MAEEPVGERDESEQTMTMQFARTFSFAGKNNFSQRSSVAKNASRFFRALSCLGDLSAAGGALIYKCLTFDSRSYQFSK